MIFDNFEIILLISSSKPMCGCLLELPCRGDSNEHPQHRFLAHLSQRLIGEPIGYPWSGVRRRCRDCQQFQTSSPLKPLGQSKPNYMWSILGKGEQTFI